jgi:hypothetical protein
MADARRIGSAVHAVDEYAWRLLAAGLPVIRVTLHSGTLHQQSSARPMYGGDPTGSIVNSVKPRGMSGGALIDLGRISASRSNPTPDTLMQDLHRSTKHSCNTRLGHTCCQAGPGWGFFRRSFFGPYYNGPQDYYGPPPAYCPPLGY